MYLKVENREGENAVNAEPVGEICWSIERREYRKVSFGIGCEHRRG